MIQNKKIITGILLIIIFMLNSTISYATTTEEELGITLGDFGPTITGAENAITILENMLGVITVIGVIATAILIAIVGISSILGSASEKAAAQEKYVGFLIGAILITSVSSIAKLIITFAENIV